MPTTTNFGWTTPADTDLVKDGALAIRTLGNGIDTSMVDLKGGTTGQILSKASNTDMDFTWIANDQGDITSVGVTSPITGGGTSGAITIAIQDATTTQKGAVQLENSTSSTSTTTAAVPSSVKSAYDLAAAAIPKSTVTTNGDLIYATGSATVSRLGIGSSGQVLTVSGGIPSWATPSSSSPTYVGCRLTKSADQTISNATFTAISFNGEDFDTDGFHDNATNNSRITIPSGKGGKYLFTVSGYWADNATGTRTVALYKNGVLIPKARSIWRRESLALSAVLSLIATDYIELFVYQDSGGNLDVNDSTSIQASFLGA